MGFTPAKIPALSWRRGLIPEYAWVPRGTERIKKMDKNQKLAELVERRRECEIQIDHAYEMARELRIARADIDREILAIMDSDGSERKFVEAEDGKYQISYTTENKRTYNTEILEKLAELPDTPDALMRKAREVKIETKWNWTGLKSLAKLSDRHREIVDAGAVITSTERILKIKGGVQ